MGEVGGLGDCEEEERLLRGLVIALETGLAGLKVKPGHSVGGAGTSGGEPARAAVGSQVGVPALWAVGGRDGGGDGGASVGLGTGRVPRRPSGFFRFFCRVPCGENVMGVVEGADRKGQRQASRVYGSVAGWLGGWVGWCALETSSVPPGRGGAGDEVREVGWGRAGGGATPWNELNKQKKLKLSIRSQGRRGKESLSVG